MKIFGRNEIVERMRKRLESKSIIFAAERRVGKTTVLTLLQENHSDECIMIYRDLEKIKTAEQLEREVYKSVRDYLSSKEKVKLKALDKFKEEVAKLETKYGSYDYKSNWQESLEEAIRALCSSTEKRIVFLWDEIPYMLQNIYFMDQKNNTNNSLTIVDTLRTLRNEIPNLRFVFTGSIGLHHIERSITQGTTSAPFNNMDTIELRPLSPDGAYEMTQHLLKEESICQKCPDEIVYSIMNRCDRIPFYIERVIKRLYEIESLTIDAVENQIDLMIADDRNELEMEHFEKRLSVYYAGEIFDIDGQKIPISKIAKYLVTHIAFAKEPMSIEECDQALKGHFKFDDIDVISGLLKALAKDYYIVADTDKRYRFKFSIIQQWWQKNLGYLIGVSHA